QRLETLLVSHAEAVLLVHDEEPEFVKRDIARQQAMRPDYDVDLATRHPPGDILRVLGAAKPRQHLDLHGIVRQALAEGTAVLLRQNRGGDEHGHLLARL